jgi:hypothetical protein
MNEEQKLQKTVIALAFFKTEIMELRVEIDELKDQVEFLKKLQMGC